MLEDGFYFVNSPGDYTKFPARITRLSKNAQTPSFAADELKFIADRGVPIAPLSEIIFVNRGIHVFHGYCTIRDDSAKNWICTCKSSQWALDWRYIPDITYHAVDLNTVLSSSTPSTVPGALFCINSLIPNGKWTAHSSTVAKLANGGLKSAIGSATLYACTSFPNAGTIDACDGLITLGSSGVLPPPEDYCYRGVDDLYVRFGGGLYLPNAFYVFAANAFDTHIRLGTIDIGTKQSNIDFALAGQASRSLQDFVFKLGRETAFSNGQDGYVYWNLDDEISRDTGKQFINGKGAWVTFADAKSPTVQAVIGLNDTNNPQPQIATNWSNRGPQLFQVYEDNSLSLGELNTKITSLLDDNDTTYKIVTTDIDYQLLPGDYVDIYKKDIGWKNLRVTKIDIDGQTMSVWVGKRLFSPSQAFGQHLSKNIVVPWKTTGTSRKTSQATKSKIVRNTTITAGSGSFVVYHDDYNLGGWCAVYEESFTVPDDDTSVSVGVFCDVAVNGKVVPPGRIRVSDSPSVSIDITAACSVSTTVDVTNTIKRNLYLATEWETTNGEVKTYRLQAFIDP